MRKSGGGVSSSSSLQAIGQLLVGKRTTKIGSQRRTRGALFPTEEEDLFYHWRHLKGGQKKEGVAFLRGREKRKSLLCRICKRERAQGRPKETPPYLLSKNSSEKGVEDRHLREKDSEKGTAALYQTGPGGKRSFIRYYKIKSKAGTLSSLGKKKSFLLRGRRCSGGSSDSSSLCCGERLPLPFSVEGMKIKVFPRRTE